jgi:hypothetical protein
METYLIYIGKAALATGAFYVAFLLLFQKQKHFTFNRIYLPVSLALSFVIPLITFTTFKYIEPVNFDANSFAYLAPASGEIAETAFVFEWYHYSFGLYLLGTAGFLLHLLLGHLKAIKIIQKSRIQRIFNSLVNITQKDVHPFSFFSKIVVSEKTLSHPDLEMIVSHENIHVRKKHTFDILFTEILFLFQWFNPFAWLLKDAVKNNLEYLTDNEIAKHFNPQTYQMAMLTLADKQGVAPFLNALNGSQLKNRIVMMKKKTENKYALVKQLVVLPLLAVLVMGLSNREVKTEIIHRSEKAKITGVPVIEKETKVSGKVTHESGKPLEGVSVLVKGTGNGAVTDNKGNFELLIDSKAETLIFDMNGFEKMEIAAGHGKTQFIETELKVDKNAKPSKTKMNGYGSNENTEAQNGGFSISGPFNGVTKQGSENAVFTPSTEKGITIKATGGQTGQPLYVIDGVETDNIEIINPNYIKSIDVLKGESGTKLYGDKGKNGVVLITTISKENLGPQNNFGNEQVPELRMPVAGDSINLKMPTAVADPLFQYYIKEKQVDYINPLEKNPKAQPLILVNGNETWQTIENINPGTIQSLNVLKDKSAIEKYGDKGKNGVIEITLKNGKENEKIATQLELRRFIAGRIKYPVVAQENNQQGVVEIWAFIEKDGTISNISEKRPDGKFINVDEVVVTSLKSEKTVTSEKSKDLELLEKESKRVIGKLSPLNIPELVGKTVSFKIRFVLE